MNRNPCLALGLLALLAGPALAQSKPGAQTPATPPAGAPALTIRNGTPNVVNNVYISLSASQAWGQDQLGANEVLPDGAQRTFRLPPGDCNYDIRIVYQGRIAEERRRIDACTEQALDLPMAAQRPR